jgi:hypothetical protein
MSTLLLFNIADPAKRTAVTLLSKRLGFTFRDVLPDRQNNSISDLLAGTGSATPAASPFSDEMLVMDRFPTEDMHMLLDSMRSAGCPVKLKCIVTETNRHWTAARLHNALMAEEAAMSAIAAAKKKRKKK